MSDYLKKKHKKKRHHRRRAHQRVRNRVFGTPERPRLAVYKSAKYVYAQIIDDTDGNTLAQASSLDPEVRKGLEKGTATIAAAEAVGKTLAERAKAKGIESVVFDRGGFVYHGKVKAIAESAREGGLQF